MSSISPAAILYDSNGQEKGVRANPVTTSVYGATYDSFGRLRISEPVTVFDSKQIVDNRPSVWDDAQTSGSGTTSTYNANQAQSTLAVSASTAGTRVRQTFRRFPYQPGKSQLILMTGVIGTPATGINRYIGLMDANNGVYWRSSPTAISVGVRSKTSGAAVDTEAAQNSWNIDKLDGTGPSGITANWATTHIFGISFSWLGVGSATFFLTINGEQVPVHRFSFANSLGLVYMSTPNLPVRYSISNDGTGGAASLTHICATVASEGGRSLVGDTYGISRGVTPLTAGNDTNIYPLMAIRLKSAYQGADIRLLTLDINCTSNATYNWYLVLNPTVTGTALSFTSANAGAIEADLTTTSATTVSGGTVLATGVESQTSNSVSVGLPSTDFRIGSSIAGVSDILVVAVQRVIGGAEVYYGAMNYQEYL